MIKTVIVDLGGVYFTDGAKEFVIKLEEQFGVPHTKTREVIDSDWGKQYRTGEITPEVFWQNAKKHWNVEIETKELSTMWFKSYVPIPEMIELVEKMTAKGFEVLFLSDNAPDRVDYLQSQYHFLSKFNSTFLTPSVFLILSSNFLILSTLPFTTISSRQVWWSR